MKHTSSLLVFVLLFSFASVPALAQEITPTPRLTPTGMHKKLEKDEKNEVDKLHPSITPTGIRHKLETEDKNETKEVKKSNNAHVARATLLSTAIQKSLNVRLTYLTNLKNRLVTRTQATNPKKDYTQAIAKLNEFDPMVQTYNSLVSTFITQVNQLIASNPTTIIADIRAAQKPLQAQLKSMQKVLTDALHLIVKAPKI